MTGPSAAAGLAGSPPAAAHPDLPGPSGTGPAAGPGGQGSAPPAGRSAPGPWRRWRVPLALAALVLLGGAAITLIAPRPPASGYLDPAGTGPYGSHALAAVASGRGATVIRTTSPAAARAASTPGTTLVITSPEYLSRRQLSALALAGRHVILIEPTAVALAAIAPQVRISQILPTAIAQPGCALTAAVLAGPAQAGETGLELLPGSPGGISCYRVDGAPSLVQYTSGARVVTVLGSGAALANGQLAQQGDAALALNLLGTGRVVWLVPSQAVAAGATGHSRTFTSLVPLGAWLVAAQLGIAVLLAAAWRARRLGPLIAERLPVVVRASETVEGHARLYAARRARERSAAALRIAARGRLLPRLGQPPDASAERVVAALAARSHLPASAITEMMYGPPPGSDAALVALAVGLDSLESEVLAQ